MGIYILRPYSFGDTLWEGLGGIIMERRSVSEGRGLHAPAKRHNAALAVPLLPQPHCTGARWKSLGALWMYEYLGDLTTKTGGRQETIECNK